MKIRDRIKGLRRVKASSLRPSPRNWRIHPKEQEDALRGLLAEIGFANVALVRELPDKSLELIDGHLRTGIAGNEKIPVIVLDVTEQEAGKLLATLDPLAAMAEADPNALQALLAEVETSSDAVRAVLDELALQPSPLNDPADVPEMPESVAENLAEMEEIRKARRRQNRKTETDRDTERYLVVVYPSRQSREAALRGLGLPADERYVAAGSVTIRAKRGIAPIRFADGAARRASDSKHSGATG